MTGGKGTKENSERPRLSYSSFIIHLPMCLNSSRINWKNLIHLSYRCMTMSFQQTNVRKRGGVKLKTFYDGHIKY